MADAPAPDNRLRRLEERLRASETGTVEILKYTDAVLDIAEYVIDKRFGEGFAKQNPSLLAGVLQTTATLDLGKRIGSAIDAAVSSGISLDFEDLCDAIRDTHTA